MSLQYFKPKVEVYKRSEFDEKTRNVCALSYPVTILPQLVQNPIFKNRPNFN